MRAHDLDLQWCELDLALESFETQRCEAAFRVSYQQSSDAIPCALRKGSRHKASGVIGMMDGEPDSENTVCRKGLAVDEHFPSERGGETA